jgi:hypothetical protein
MFADIAAIMKETLVAGRLKPAVSVVLIGVSSVLTVTNVEERLRIHRRCKPDGTHSSCDMSVIKNPPVNLPVKELVNPPINPHANLSVNTPVNTLIYPPINTPVNPPVNPYVTDPSMPCK